METSKSENAEKHRRCYSDVAGFGPIVRDQAAHRLRKFYSIPGLWDAHSMKTPTGICIRAG